MGAGKKIEIRLETIGQQFGYLQELLSGYVGVEI
jgi:hypothetical protein